MYGIFFLVFVSIASPLVSEDPHKCEKDVCCSGYRMENNTCVECKAGTHGINCSETCPLGYFGVQCKEMCTPEAGENCSSKAPLNQVHEQTTEMESTGKFTKRPYDIGREESWTHSLDYISGIFILHIVLTVSIFGLVFAAFYTAWKIRVIFGIIKDYRKTKSDACIRYRTRESGRISQYNGLGYQSAVDGGSDYILPVSVGQIEQYRNIV